MEFLPESRGHRGLTAPLSQSQTGKNLYKKDYYNQQISLFLTYGVGEGKEQIVKKRSILFY